MPVVVPLPADFAIPHLTLLMRTSPAAENLQPGSQAAGVGFSLLNMHLVGLRYIGILHDSTLQQILVTGLLISPA